MSKKDEEKEEKRTPPSIFWEDFKDGELPTESSNTKVLIIAIDNEYQSNFTANENRCLSYQFSGYDMRTATYKSGIFYMNVNVNERLTLGEFIHKVLDAMGIKPSSLKDYRIILVAHFFPAEWSMFKDRINLYPKFEFIRKTMITTSKPLETTIKDENGEIVHLWFDVRDTILLLPDGYKSLEKASTFIEGFEKIDLSEEEKSNMYQVLQDKRELFEEYAIRDAEVTLRLFIKLQSLLNKINGSLNELYTTLSSATTRAFKGFSRSKFKEIKLKNTYDSNGKKKAGSIVHSMQFNRFHDLYMEYESLADRAYMGGLNSSYHIGHCEGYTFIDIDFKNAYPTAMNLLKIGDFGEKVKKTKKPERREIIL